MPAHTQIRRRTGRRSSLFGGLVGVWLVCAPALAVAEGETPELLVLPFANFSGRSGALEMVLPLLYAELESRAVVHVQHRDLRPLLRGYRIRSVGRLEGQGARKLREETGARACLLGSVDIFGPDHGPEIAISTRVLDLDRRVLLGTAQVAVSGRSFAGLFGVGEVTEMPELARRAVNRLVGELTMILENARPARGPRVAVLPLENGSDRDFAHDVVRVAMISAFARRGFDVVEPGLLHEVFLQQRVAPAGMIDLATLAAVGAELDVSYTVTGTVDRLEVARAEAETSVPQLTCGIRLMGVPSGRILLAKEIETTGPDARRLFGLGREPSLGRLLERTMDQLVNEMDELIREVSR